MLDLISKRERLILLITVGVIAFSALFSFIIVPILSRNADLNRQINYERLKLDKYRKLLSQKDSIQQKYNKFAKAYKGLNQQDDALVLALGELEGLAKDAGIRMIDIRPQGSSKDSSSYVENVIDLRLEGDMNGLLKFIYNMENSLSLFKIKSMELSAKTNNGGLDASFSISQFLARDK